jgi:hypothetical protein
MNGNDDEWSLLLNKIAVFVCLDVAVPIFVCLDVATPPHQRLVAFVVSSKTTECGVC